MIKIVVDIQGADRSPELLLCGALQALYEKSDLYIYLCGDKERVLCALEGKNYPAERLVIVDAPEVIGNNENPVEAFGAKKNSSIVKGLALCREKSDIGGFVSCGATGAIMVGAMMTLKKNGISPVLLCELMRTDGTPFCVADCGANVDCRPEKLVYFAKMGSAYMRALGVQNPKIALLSNGAEDKKGSATVKSAHGLLRESGLNFIGNTEGCDVLTDKGDVIVCDGFSGNILLKTIEGSAKAVIKEISALSENLCEEDKEKAAALLCELNRHYNYTNCGGALLLGFDIPIIKGHGSANAGTMYNIVIKAYELAKNDLNGKIKAEMEK